MAGWNVVVPFVTEEFARAVAAIIEDALGYACDVEPANEAEEPINADPNVSD